MKRHTNVPKPKDQGRNWLCTLNNPDTALAEEYLRKWKESPKCNFVTGQVEKGEQGTVHLQYFLNFSDNVRLSGLKKICSRSHFQIVKVNNGADDYCNKEETRVEGPWTFGQRPARLNKAGDKARLNRELLEMGPEKAVAEGIIDIGKYLQLKKNIDAYKLATTTAVHCEGTRGTWIWGPPGVGKSHYARNNFDDIYLKAQNKWFDGYTGQKTILLDDHDNGCLGHFLKIWTDKYACTAESKGATIPLMHRDFVVTSNYPIEHIYGKDGDEMVQALKRRFKVIHMDKPFDRPAKPSECELLPPPE